MHSQSASHSPNPTGGPLTGCMNTENPAITISRGHRAGFVLHRQAHRSRYGSKAWKRLLGRGENHIPQYSPANSYVLALAAVRSRAQYRLRKSAMPSK